jgi:ubiquinone/menaquinone biosynthesis C-methylase UbiE
VSLDRIRRQWEGFGRDSPLSAILTRDEPWETNEFFETGRVVVDRLYSRMLEYCPPLRRRRVLDFGCGIGRLTQPWSQYFEEAVGVDVSASMIEQAEKKNRERNPFAARCRFVLNPVSNLRQFPDQHFDLVASFLVLQHMPRTLSDHYIREFARVLSPGGSLVIQLPTGPLDPPSRWERVAAEIYFRLVWDVFIRKPRMEMHGTPRAELERLIQQAGLRLEYAEPDGAAGPDWESFTYYCSKP